MFYIHIQIKVTDIHTVYIGIVCQVRTFKYMPAIYDTSKFYKSELKKTDTMESIQPNADMDDSDDEEDMSALPTRSNYTLQVSHSNIKIFFISYCFPVVVGQ